MMTEQQNEHPVSTVESLPADSSWWTFFKTDYFGKNYCNFKGRASRREWWATSVLGMLFSFIIGLGGEIISLILFLYFLVPNLAITARRLHDIGYGFLRLFLISIILFCFVWLDSLQIFNGQIYNHIKMIFFILTGSLMLFWCIIMLALPFCAGDKKDNKYGKNIYNETKK